MNISRLLQASFGLAFLFGTAGQSLADTKPISLFLFSPVQTSKPADSITGLRLGLIYGDNASVTGFDWGLVNHLSGDLTGLQNSAWGQIEGNLTGIQWNFLASIAKGNVTGIQGAIYNQAGNIEGIQMGWVNRANKVKGLQLGVLNMTQSMNGLQIGLVNVIKQDGAFPVFPIVNWSF
ncbi:MAG: hypothetical protein KC518_09520 [Candidatus Cloacimonetes bacterium]|nr:hypothetical protein [Candidatus Cloacimonadota bacterium]